MYLHHAYFSKSHSFFVLFFLRHLTLPGSLVVGYSSVFADPVPFTEITTTKWELWIGFKGEKEIKTRQKAYVTPKTDRKSTPIQGHAANGLSSAKSTRIGTSDEG